MMVSSFKSIENNRKKEDGLDISVSNNKILFSDPE